MNVYDTLLKNFNTNVLKLFFSVSKKIPKPYTRTKARLTVRLLSRSRSPPCSRTPDFARSRTSSATSSSSPCSSCGTARCSRSWSGAAASPCHTWDTTRRTHIYRCGLQPGNPCTKGTGRTGPSLFCFNPVEMASCRTIQIIKRGNDNEDQYD